MEKERKRAGVGILFARVCTNIERGLWTDASVTFFYHFTSLKRRGDELLPTFALSRAETKSNTSTGDFTVALSLRRMDIRGGIEGKGHKNTHIDTSWKMTEALSRKQQTFLPEADSGADQQTQGAL